MMKHFSFRGTRRQSLPLLALGMIMGVTVPQGTSAALQILDSINGEDLAAIQATLPSLRDRRLAPEAHNIFVGAGAAFVGVVYQDEKDSSKIVGIRVNPAGDLTAAEASGILMGRAVFQLRGKLHGSSLGPMIAALPVFAQQKGLHLDQYRLELIREKTSFIVTFLDKTSQPGGLGNPGPLPGFEVVLNAQDLKVLRSHYIR